MNNLETEKCCNTTCDLPLNETYWNNQYLSNTTGWDLGQVSPPLKAYIDQLTNKNLRILIPGSGNSYEADYLLDKGFINITIIDIAPALVEKLKNKYFSNPEIKIIQGDFFEHQGTYDLIVEQTFFCAINPSLRKNYVSKMKELLSETGRLVGLLFNRTFEHQGPPFGGSKCQYLPLFKNDFTVTHFDQCYNSFSKREGTELFINLLKK